MEKTVGLVVLLQQELDTLGERIQLASLYGSIARSQETSDSDVDLMIVGTAGLSDLILSLRRAEQALGRPVNPPCFLQRSSSGRQNTTIIS
jgi:predicted nucleotidyltransferase